MQADADRQAGEEKIVSPAQTQSAGHVVERRGHEQGIEGEAQGDPADDVCPAGHPAQEMNRSQSPRTRSSPSQSESIRQIRLPDQRIRLPEVNRFPADAWKVSAARTAAGKRKTSRARTGPAGTSASSGRSNGMSPAQTAQPKR